MRIYCHMMLDLELALDGVGRCIGKCGPAASSRPGRQELALDGTAVRNGRSWVVPVQCTWREVRATTWRTRASRARCGNGCGSGELIRRRVGERRQQLIALGFRRRRRCRELRLWREILRSWSPIHPNYDNNYGIELVVRTPGKLAIAVDSENISVLVVVIMARIRDLFRLL
jgi:hypothetical protein